jgi:hypothetical protein
MAHIPSGFKQSGLSGNTAKDIAASLFGCDPTGSVTSPVHLVDFVNHGNEFSILKFSVALHITSPSIEAAAAGVQCIAHSCSFQAIR